MSLRIAKVRPGLWRSNQPTTDVEWQIIANFGIRQIVKLNFEQEGSDAPAMSYGFAVHQLSIDPNRPDVWLLALANWYLQMARPDDPCLVHCLHGRDRTGLVVGRDRVLNGWSKADAYKEMLEYGFHPELTALQAVWDGIS